MKNLLQAEATASDEVQSILATLAAMPNWIHHWVRVEEGTETGSLLVRYQVRSVILDQWVLGPAEEQGKWRYHTPCLAFLGDQPVGVLAQDLCSRIKAIAIWRY